MPNILDKLEKSDREKKLDMFIRTFKSQAKWENELTNNIIKWRKKYKKELEDYMFIKTIEDFNKLDKGGYIRYINLNDELRWGGFYVKSNIDKKTGITTIVLGNSDYKMYNISFENNYIFYKKHTTPSDKTRKLFISMLEKYDN